MFCSNCGAAIDDNAYVCVNCGVAVNRGGVAPTYQQGYVGPQGQPALEPGSRKLNVGMLVWSIINTLLFGGILGIIGIILTAVASGEVFRQDELKRLKAAKIVNIVSTVLGVLIIALAIFMLVLIIMYSPELIEDPEFYNDFYYTL